MMDVKKIYYPGNGGAFRIFIAKNEENYFIPNLNNSLSSLEKKFIKQYSSKLNFKKNLFPLKDAIAEEKLQHEWYDLSDNFFSLLIKDKEKIWDINDNLISKEMLNIASQTANIIRNKNIFYKIVSQINSDYLLPNWKIIKDVNNIEKYKTEFIYPIIVKSCNGKGGKGNLVCNNSEDLTLVKEIFASELFAKKQERHTYNPKEEIIIEKFISDSSSYNLSFYCNLNGQMSDVNISEQIIEEVFYRGNIYPAYLNTYEKNKILQIGKDICNYMHKKFQYYGWLGLDFIKIGNEIYVIEANPRVNSVTHAHSLSDGNAFIIRLMKYNTKNYNHIFNSFYFNHSKKTGILPYQLPNSDEILIISIAETLNLAKSQLEEFSKENALTTVIQSQTKTYSKSISYYLSKKK